MELQTRPLSFDAGALRGLSQRLLESHHANNYGGAVKRLNAIHAQLGALDWSSTPVFVVNGLKREELVAANSMVLHELYFDALGGDGVLAEGGLSVGLERDFGSVQRWRAEFMALAKAMAGGSGWAVLAWSAREARLVNHWAADHTHQLAGATPLLALDMYEHAYHLDYGANAGAYVEAFMDNVHWPVVAERYGAAVQAASAGLGVDAASALGSGMQLIDVRRAGAYEASAQLAAGAVWRDPAVLDAWAGSLDAARPVAVYCVRGHEVSQSAALALRARGVDARYVPGGIEGWVAAGLPVQDKPA
jgi:Fe-Mn family superoxide dismutase